MLLSNCPSDNDVYLEMLHNTLRYHKKPGEAHSYCSLTVVGYQSIIGLRKVVLDAVIVCHAHI